MGDFLSLGSLKCSNIAGHKGIYSTKVACGHVQEENCGGPQQEHPCFSHKEQFTSR